MTEPEPPAPLKLVPTGEFIGYLNDIRRQLSDQTRATEANNTALAQARHKVNQALQETVGVLSSAQLAQGDAINRLEGRVGSIEEKLDKVLEVAQQNGAKSEATLEKSKKTFVEQRFAIYTAVGYGVVHVVCWVLKVPAPF